MIKKSSTTKDIVKNVAKKTGIDKTLASKILGLYLDQIEKALLENKQVRLVNFGTFEVTKWKKPEIYDPNVKRKVTKELKTIKFQASSVLKKKVLE